MKGVGGLRFCSVNDVSGYGRFGYERFYLGEVLGRGLGLLFALILIFSYCRTLSGAEEGVNFSLRQKQFLSTCGQEERQKEAG
jgi:hypothetical protein